MIFSILRTIQAWAAPDHRLRCSRGLWNQIWAELRDRSAGVRESGAFLLGSVAHDRRIILDAVYYDDLAPESLRSGAILFPGRAYGRLWEECRRRSMQVVADVHTHPGPARQSSVDRNHPMIAERGHVALIVPEFATGQVREADLGVYEYQGAKAWRNHSGSSASRYFLRTL